MIATALAKRIKLVGLDVDGVLTDGGIYLGDVGGTPDGFAIDPERVLFADAMRLPESVKSSRDVYVASVFTTAIRYCAPAVTASAAFTLGDASSAADWPAALSATVVGVAADVAVSGPLFDHGGNRLRQGGGGRQHDASGGRNQTYDGALVHERKA